MRHREVTHSFSLIAQYCDGLEREYQLFFELYYVIF